MTMKEAVIASKPRGSFARGLRRDEKGVAAVEFALILPLMVTLYLGCAEITQGVLASRKMAIVSRTLSDLVAQHPTSNSGSAIASSCTNSSGMCDAVMSSIFGAASAIMSPFSTAYLTGTTPTLTMVVSSVEFVANGTSPAPATVANGYEAQVRWSKAAADPNAGTTRSCVTKLTPVSNSTTPTAANLPSGLYSSGSVIVADVSYKYDPTFGGSVLAWVNAGGSSYISMSNTTYMRPRNWTTYLTYKSTEVTGASCTG